ncbi:MAG: phosphodiester glycosidase family protein [Pyrinomonadaceae bacterium]
MRFPVSLLLSLCALCALCGSTLAQDYKQVGDGVEYAELTRTIDGLPLRMNLLKLDLEKVRLDVVHANDRAIGTETTSSIAKRHNAFAAINAGFFRLDKSEFAGDPAGVLMIDGKLVSESFNDRTAMIVGYLKRSMYVTFGRVNAYTSILFGSRDRFDSFNLSGTNRERKRDEAVIYSPFFGPSTLTKDKGIEILLGRCRTGKLIGSFPNIKCKKIEVRNDSANSPIPADGYVISFGPDFFSGGDPMRAKFRDVIRQPDRKLQIQIRDQVSLDGGQYTTDERSDITNGIPRLIRGGKIDITWKEEKTSRSFVETRHPRTAVAKLRDGKFLMITVDGRSESSGGIGLQQLAEFLLEMGATDAINLDGGGSTTMYLNGKVVNRPSDKEGERNVGDAIIVTLRRGRN